MKRKTKTGILVLVLLLAVGFAAVSTSLVINGTANFGANADDFEVIFTSAIVDGEDKSTTAISEDGKTLTYTTSELAIIGEKSVLDFTVKNTSKNYDAKVTIECNATGEKANNYYTVTPSFVESVAAQTTENGKVTVELTKTSVDEIEETFTCTISAVAQERETVGEYIPEPFIPSYFALVKPTTSSSTDYTTIGKNVFVGLDINNSMGVCINDGVLFCIKNNDYENSIALLDDHFGKDKCFSYDGGYGCVSDSFVCGAGMYGSVACNVAGGGFRCDVRSDNYVNCDDQEL